MPREETPSASGVLRGRESFIPGGNAKEVAYKNSRMNGRMIFAVLVFMG
jgi:hypothetical protein